MKILKSRSGIATVEEMRSMERMPVKRQKAMVLKMKSFATLHKSSLQSKDAVNQLPKIAQGKKNLADSGCGAAAIGFAISSWRLFRPSV